MEPWLYIAAIAAGFAAGVINTLAGNGSSITLPLLIFMGLPATVANGTNRIGVLMQTIASTFTYHRREAMPWSASVMLIGPTALGGLLGARIAVDLNEEQMRLAIGGMLVLTFFLILLRPERWLRGRVGGALRPRWYHLVLFFAIGLYGGFIQAGVGIFLLVALVLGLGHDLVKSNAIKSFLVLALNVLAFIVFVRNGQVDWLLGTIVAVGQLVGGWAAVHVATQTWAQVWVYRLLMVVVLVSAVQMFVG
ncbi:MAG: sulfite exporter TauE/SafE family protein [Caldilineales bacterium]|nr:sulfite exporter TauE/SafE family protein [Caldilineales bacterium]